MIHLFQFNIIRLNHDKNKCKCIHISNVVKYYILKNKIK